MEPLLVFPDPPSDFVADMLGPAGYAIAAVASSVDAVGVEPGEGFIGAVVDVRTDPGNGYGLLRALRKRDKPLSPVLLVVSGRQLDDLDFGEGLFDDFVVEAASPQEGEIRLARLLAPRGMGNRHDVIVYGPLALNLETYQAVVERRPLDLTYMEYELLRFLASHPGKVFTREILLSRVWGYEYFGGARTVDVHIRRLRAKLGEEHAHLIETVRSVGYRFGTLKWLPPAPR
ncbi:MAG: winged helix-turn-helix transcriptional regulator [Acidimicrobiales bacterium]